MKKTCVFLAAVLLVSMLSACSDNVKDIAKAVQDTSSKYSQQIEDSKEAIENGLSTMQGLLDDMKAKASGN